jgi:hypothetical protein
MQCLLLTLNSLWAIVLKRPMLLKNSESKRPNSDSLIFEQIEEMRDDGTIRRRRFKALL